MPTLTLTSEAFLNLIKGKELFADGVYRIVDIRDVALAHILAFENPSASGRYCLVKRVTYSFEILDILNQIFPSLPFRQRGLTIVPPFPTSSYCRRTENLPARPPYQVSIERAKSLGINFTPLEVSLKDTVECLKEKNLLSF
ncbi:Cinnamoyl-CoA reductase 1 [Sesamum angolense]|uniref:Cinnamoyl-CoA reductase 1 n=1 Tax=Sesamum angolense TaxID=2727404 RepID=A0AAE1XFQ4_9LAMI|nr:Cinnamoyl-CoA reductase 1 [Sesamum angolense]